MEFQHHCPKCSEQTDFPYYCESCSLLHPFIGENNPFLFFNLPLKYKLKEQDVEEAFENSLSVLHPDLYSDESEDQVCLSEKYSILAKTHRDTLLNPHSRGISLLSEIFGEIKEEISTDQGFLIEMFSLQEELESNPDDLTKSKAIKKMDLFFSSTADFLEEIAKNKNAELLPKAFDLLARMKFWITAANLLGRKFPGDKHL